MISIREDEGRERSESMANSINRNFRQKYLFSPRL